jgi:hypothetical protein
MPDNTIPGRVEIALWAIWREYRRDFESTPTSEIQDLRALSILWTAVFIPECISLRLRRSLAKTVRQYRERADYGHACWHRILPVEAALYAITRTESWLSAILANLDHHKSSLRTFTVESLALIADRLEFDAETLQRIGRNLDVRHFFCEWPVILFAVSKGSAECKRLQIELWLGLYEMNANERAILEALARGEMVENPFLHRALRVQQFMTLRLACTSPEAEEQLNLDDTWESVAEETESEERDQMKLFADGPDELGQAVWARLSAHPLTNAMIQIRDYQRAAV